MHMRMSLALMITVMGLLSCSEWNDDLYREPVPEPDEDPGIVTADGQLYNMNLDMWTKDGSNENCFGPGATYWQKRVWASPNATTSMMGYNTAVPEREFVAVSGPGKAAVKLQTCHINKLGVKKLASGCLFTGQMGGVDILSMNASLNWGVKFSLKPKSMEGYACYKPKTINVVKPPYESYEGQMDKAHLYVILADWDSQFVVDPAKSQFFDPDNDPAVIGYGIVTFDHEMSGYEKFTINIEYRNERTPRYLVIVGASSRLGDYFTGGNGSTLYLDEFKFNY